MAFGKRVVTYVCMTTLHLTLIECSWTTIYKSHLTSHFTFYPTQSYWKLDASAYEYPKISVPWDPKDAVDPKLNQIRDDRGYSYADIITVQADTLPDYETKVKAFFEEHIHDAEEIRYILGGSGYFDVRNKQDTWVRIHIKAGDLMTLPEGIYHRFTVDEADSIHAMRLFIGQPVWTPFNRPQEDHESRKKYVEGYLEEKK